MHIQRQCLNDVHVDSTNSNDLTCSLVRFVVVCRLHPTPGHAKAMNFSFGLAKKFDGQCIMRFDDTNPEAEKGEYIDNILENLEWLGHKPTRITYSSDYFQQLYDLAVVLIRKGKAYVDHQTAEEIRKSRETKIPSPYRERPIEESVKLFEDMRKVRGLHTRTHITNTTIAPIVRHASMWSLTVYLSACVLPIFQGKFAEGKATLRMKGDMNHSNPQMWDLVAYRIKYCEHPHVGNQWCIYPSYDYTRQETTTTTTTKQINT